MTSKDYFLALVSRMYWTKEAGKKSSDALLMVEEMKANGYCDHCCNVILKYAANNLWKD